MSMSTTMDASPTRQLVPVRNWFALALDQLVQASMHYYSAADEMNRAVWAVPEHLRRDLALTLSHRAGRGL
jgi:hypothetical protein